MGMENYLNQPIIFIFFVALLFLWFLSSPKRGRRDGGGNAPPVPEAGGAWPLIGHLHLFRSSVLPHVTLGKLVEKYGPVFTIRMGVHHYLIVSSLEIAKECFTVNDKAFAGRPKLITFEVLGYDYSVFAFSPYGAYWRQVRKIAILELLSPARVELVSKVMTSEVKIAIQDSYDPAGKTVEDMKIWFWEVALNITFRAVVGKSFHGADEGTKEIKKSVRAVFDMFVSFLVGDAFPYLRWLDLDGGEKVMKRTAKELDRFADIWLEEHKRRRNCGEGESKHEHDFMDALLGSVDRELEGHDVDTVVKSTCIALFLAGTDTTTEVMTSALSLLLNNREVLKKAINELDTQIGKERMVAESDLKNLVYLQAIVKETLRMHPPIPLDLLHESIEDCIVGGYHVPAGTRLMVNISKIHRDPTIYPDPSEFRPERFLTTHKSTDFRGQHFELIPFGAGRRMCPGLSFGTQMVQLTLANVLHCFHIVTADGKPVESIGRVGTKIPPFRVILTPRLAAPIYGENCG